MLKIGSGRVIVVGFTRAAEPAKLIEGCEAINLGRTKDGHLLERIGSVASVALRLDRLEPPLGGMPIGACKKSGDAVPRYQGAAPIRSRCRAGF